MIHHPEYPDFLEAALASDWYWQQPEGLALPQGTISEIAMELYRAPRERKQLSVRADLAQQIGDVLVSLESGGTIEPLVHGDELPIPTSRQVLKVVEDSRLIYSKLSPPYLFDAATKARTLQELKKYFGEAIRYSTFAEDLVALYGTDLPFDTAAASTVNYGRTKKARIARAVYYLKLDTVSGKFAALPAIAGDKPSLLDEIKLTVIPRTVVGGIYVKGAGYLGKIMAADIVETNGIVWTDDDEDSASHKRPKPNLKGWLPKLSRAPIAV